MIAFETYADIEEVSAAAVRHMVEAYEKTKGPFRIALCGGRTPGRAYELMGRERLDWERVHIYWGDERYVPPSDPDSNEGLARRTLLQALPIPDANVHSIYIEGGPVLAAATYAKVLEGVSLDFCFQGLGSDGHTASLFPGDDASLRSDELVVHTCSPVGTRDRISLTPKAFVNAKKLVFLASGEDKRISLQRVIAGERLPSRIVAEAAAEAVFLIDAAAMG